MSCLFAHFSLRRFVARRRAASDPVPLRVRVWPLEIVNGDSAAFPTTTIAILGTATLAYQQGIEQGEAFNLAIRDALFEHGQAVGDPDVLVGIADGCGVTGSPHFFVDGHPFFCPTLNIDRQGEHLHIVIDNDELDTFLGRALH